MNDHDSISLVTAPVVEPLSLAEAKEHLRVVTSDEDGLIQSLIGVARERIENDTRRALFTQTLRLSLDSFPSRACQPGRDGSTILVPRPPLQSVTNITYVDGDGTTQTLSASDYLVDTRSEPGRITPAYGLSWPGTRTQMNAVTITYVAGWTASNLPQSAKALMRLLVAHFFENREPVNIGNIVNEIPLAATALTAQLSCGNYR